MAESITVKLPQAGDVLIERSYRAKHVRLSFRPPSNVRIAVPLGISFKVAQKFAKEKESWIKQLEWGKLKHKSTLPSPKPIIEKLEYD